MFFAHLILHYQGYMILIYFVYNILTTLSVRHGLAVAMIIGEIILSLMLSLHECDHAPQCIHTRSVIHNPSHTHVFVHHPASLILIYLYIQNCGIIRIYGSFFRGFDGRVPLTHELSYSMNYEAHHASN